MNLDNLKSAWKQHKLENSLSIISHDEILQIIDEPEMINYRVRRLVGNIAMFLILLLGCQGG